MNQKKAFEIVLDVKKIFESLGADYWLNLGTCLGLYRDKKFIDLPDEDIDIGLVYSPAALVLPQHLKNKGFNIQEVRTLNDKFFHISTNRDGIHICFDIYHPYPKNLFFFYTETYAYYFFHPTIFTKGNVSYKFKDTGFRFPYYVVDYLEFQYGPNWKVPLKKMVAPHISHTPESIRIKEGAIK